MRPSPPQSPQGGATWLLGSDAPVRRGMSRMLYSTPFYLAGIAIESYAAAAVPGCDRLGWLALYTLVGFGTFWWLIRSGRTRSRDDPRLSHPQMLFAVTTAAAAYVSAAAMRGPAIELLCLSLVFDMHRVSARQFLTVSCGSVLLCAALCALWLAAGDGVDPGKDVSNLAVTMVAIAAVSTIAMQSHSVRRSQLKDNLALEDAVRRVQHMADHDALTGLPNRRYARARFDALSAVPEAGALVLALFDVDRFKAINDRHGHAIGDAVLQRLSDLLRNAHRPNDVMARWGGEEFLALLRCASFDEAMGSIERLRQRVAGHDWSALAPGLQVTVSVGAALHLPPEPFEMVVQRADGVLYQAKRLGRNRVQRA